MIDICTPMWNDERMTDQPLRIYRKQGGRTDRLQSRVTPDLRAEVQRLALIDGKSEQRWIEDTIINAVIARRQEIRA